MKKLICVLSNNQIMSALIWAFVLIACGYASGNENVSMILMTAAGIHVVMMMQFSKKESKIQSSDL